MELFICWSKIGVQTRLRIPSTTWKRLALDKVLITNFVVGEAGVVYKYYVMDV